MFTDWSKKPSLFSKCEKRGKLIIEPKELSRNVKSKMTRFRRKNPLRTWFWRNFKAVLSNNRKRIVFLCLHAFLIVFLLYLLSYTLEYNKDMGLANQLFALGFYVLLLFFPFKYIYKSGLQILFEGSLNDSTYNVRGEIERIRRQKKDFRALQVKINNFRRDLKNFIDYSEIISPPVYGYELNRLQKGIDIFFNSISEVLFSKPNVFSRAQKIEQQQTLDYYESLEHPTEEEIEEHFEQMAHDEEGIINWFDLYALDEFLQYLGDTLFARTDAFSPFSYKHPIDLITLSRFFDHWNSVVSSCRNCRSAFKKSKEDIEEYYKLLGRRESERRQRMRRLTDDALIVIISVVLSIIVNYLLK
jgi:hypothetical protein